MLVPSDSAVSLEVGSQIMHHDVALQRRLRRSQSWNPLTRWCLSRFYRTAWTLLAQARPRRILDVGCGEGYFWHVLAQHGPLPPIVALDRDYEALEVAQELCPDLTFRHRDLFECGEVEKSFDLVVANGVLEHQSQPERFLEKLCHYTRGNVLLSVPRAPWYRLGNFFSGRDVFRLGRPMDHVQSWTVETFRRFVHPFMDVLAVETVFPRIVLLGRARVIEYEALQGDELFVQGCRQ